MAAAIVIPFVLTLIVGKKRLTDSERNGTEIETEVVDEKEVPVWSDAEKNEDAAAPAAGKIIDITEVEDQTFASKIMGDGFAIEPSDGRFVAPYSGEITAAFPTGHAYGIRTAGGREVLIHIGMDTVELEGKGFNVHVKQGDIVRQGDPLVDVDLDYVRSQGKSAVTPVVFTDGTGIELLKKDQKVQTGEKGIIRLQ